jgi:putative transposase
MGQTPPPKTIAPNGRPISRRLLGLLRVSSHQPQKIIRFAVTLSPRYPLSLCNDKDLLHKRGIEISHETVRRWGNRFGPMFAADLRRKRVDRPCGHTHARWQLDPVFVKISGVMHDPCRAVDHEGEVMDSGVAQTGDRKAALTFLKKSATRHGRRQNKGTDRLHAYGAAVRDIGHVDDRETGRCLGNRLENAP